MHSSTHQTQFTEKSLQQKYDASQATLKELTAVLLSTNASLSGVLRQPLDEMPAHNSQQEESRRARLSLDLDAATKARLETLVQREGLASLTDLIKKSVSLFDIVTEHASGGGTIVFKHPDGRMESVKFL